jgi:hypothetical protein
VSVEGHGPDKFVRDDLQRRKAAERKFDASACERLAASSQAYYSTHGDYVPVLAWLLNETRRERDLLSHRADWVHPDDLARVEAELKQRSHRCQFPDCVEGEKPKWCGLCGDALRAEAAEAELARFAESEARLKEGLRQRERLLRWALNYIGIDWDESYPDEPPAVTEARSLLASELDTVQQTEGSEA